MYLMTNTPEPLTQALLFRLQPSDRLPLRPEALRSLIREARRLLKHIGSGGELRTYLRLSR